MTRLLLLAVLMLGVGACELGQAARQERITQHTLPDGTRCVVFKAGYAGGIDCDFAEPTP